MPAPYDTVNTMIRTQKTRGGLASELTLPSRAYQATSRALVRSIPYIPSSDRYNITICHQRRFVWFRVAKVGTRTIFDVFQRANITLDAEHPMFCHYPVNLYKKYFKFAFVRNPWDRLVSCWRNKVIDANYFRFSADDLRVMQEFENFVDLVATRDLETCDQHIRLQSKLIDLSHIDFLGRFEHFEEHLAEVMRIIGLGSLPIGQKNTSREKAHYRQYYSADLRDRVAEAYRRDIRIFGYEF